MLALLIIFIAAILIVPIGSGLGNLFISGHDDTHVLQSESSVIYIQGKPGPVPFSQVNGTATFDMPSVTKDNTTTYYHTVYLRTNLTLEELNNFAVSKIILSTSDKGNLNVTMGTGNMSDFVPIVSSSATNGTSVTLSISPQLLTGNQTAPVTMELTANVTSMSISVQTFGNNGLVTIFGPMPVIQVTYIIGAVLLFGAAFLEMSFYDINIHAVGSAFTKGGRKA